MSYQWFDPTVDRPRDDSLVIGIDQTNQQRHYHYFAGMWKLLAGENTGYPPKLWRPV